MASEKIELQTQKKMWKIIKHLLYGFVMALIFYWFIFFILNQLTCLDSRPSLKDAITFGCGVSSIILAISLYSDWREKYIFENVDKDLRAIQVLTSELKFIINQVPTSDSDVDKKDKRDFYEKYWELKVHSSYLENFSDPEITILLNRYINLLKDSMSGNFDEICNQLKNIENTCDDLHKKISDERQKIFLENS